MGEKPMTLADLIKWHQRRADTAAYNADERDLAFHEQAAACIREMVERLEMVEAELEVANLPPAPGAEDE